MTGPGRRAGAPARGSRGSAAVEFALVLPLLLLMLLALLQVGLLARDDLLLQEAARAGAREAAVTPDDDAVRGAVVDAASALDAAAIVVSVELEGGSGAPVAVRVRYAAPIAVPLARWLLPAEVDLVATAVMRMEVG